MELIKTGAQAVIGFVCFWLVMWAMTYTACVAEYKSSACKQDLTSQIVLGIIKK